MSAFMTISLILLKAVPASSGGCHAHDSDRLKKGTSIGKKSKCLIIVGLDATCDLIIISTGVTQRKNCTFSSGRLSVVAPLRCVASPVHSIQSSFATQCYCHCHKTI
eukprot:5272493-Amphidinium_carterae.2